MMSKVKKLPKIQPIRIPDIDLSAIKLPVVKAFNPFKVKPLEGQIRQRFAGIEELAGSIQAVGQMLPVIVTEISGDPNYDAELVDGERRVAACMHLKRGIIAFLWDGKTDPEDIYAASVAANHGRQNHDPIEILNAIQRFRKNGKSYGDIATIFGKSIGWVSQHYILRKLHPTVQKWLIPVVSQNGDSSNGKPKSGPNSNGKPKLLSIAGGLDVTDMKRTGSRKVKSAISFQLAMDLAKIPENLQITAGREIISQKMSLVEAKRHLIKIGRGIQGFQRRAKPSERRNTFLSVTSRINHMIGTYADMPFEELHTLLQSLAPSDLRHTERALQKVAEYSGSLLEDVRREMRKTAAAAV